MKRNDGGPAFPDDGQADYTGGMTLRDWFAGQALVAIGTAFPDTVTAKVAEWAYEQADAMLVHRDLLPGIPTETDQ